MPALLPLFRRRSSHDSPPARDENGQLHAVLSIDGEELLLWVVVAHHLLTLRVAQQPEQTAVFAVDGIPRTRKRRFFVEGLSILEHEERRSYKTAPYSLLKSQIPSW